MTLDEKKTKMAVRLGWKEHTDKNGTYSGSHAIKKGWLRKKAGHSGVIIHDYEWKERWQLHEDSDANTRKDILAVMTEEEKRSLIKQHLGRTDDFPFNLLALTLILELTQPEFFELAGQVMGLWET